MFDKMSPTGKRSARLSKLNQSADQMSPAVSKNNTDPGTKDKASGDKKSSAVTTYRSNLSNSPRARSKAVSEKDVSTDQHEDEKEGKQVKFDGDASTTETPKAVKSLPPSPMGQSNASAKKKKASLVPPTPPSAVRRSGRAPVPSSRYKDMEVETPGISRKRSLVAASVSEESDMEQEPPKKRDKKLSKNVKSESALANDMKLNDSKFHNNASDRDEENTAGAIPDNNKNSTNTTITNSPQKSVLTSQIITGPLELSQDEASCIPQYYKKDDETKEERSDIPLPQTTHEEMDEEENVPVSVEEMIEKSLQEGKMDKKDLEVCSSANEIVMEEPTIGTEAKSHDEVSQPGPQDQEPTEETTVSTLDQQVQEEQQPAPPPPSLTIGGQQVTFTERDGETVAIVTMPPGLGDGQSQIIPVSTGGEGLAAAGKAGGQPLTEVVSVIPNSQGGHTVVTGTSVAAPDSTPLVSGSLNMTIEARQFSSLLRPKSKNTNPVKGHGRVIPRAEQQLPPGVVLKGGVGNPSLATNSFATISSSKDIQTQKQNGLPYSLLTSLGQTPSTSVETARHSVHGSIAPRLNQKVIVVSQKSSEGRKISTLQDAGTAQSLAQFQSQSGSTVVHVKKAPGATLTASDLECVFKALSGTGGSGPVQMSEVPSTAVASEEEESAPSNTVMTETNALPLEGTSAGEGAEMQANNADDKSPEREAGETLTQETPNFDNSQNVAEDAAEDNTEETGKVENEENVMTLDVAEKEEGASCLETAQNEIEAPTVVAPSETLPVESALYQALQALEPQTVIEEQTAPPEESNPSPDLPTTGEAEGEEEKPENWKVKSETIKVVDNGIEYDVRIVCQEDVAEEVVDDSMHQDKTDAVASDITLKEEPIEEDVTMDESGMQTSGTQTLYSPSIEKGSTIQRMTTVVDKDGQKKQVYYVSVFPGKGVLNKVKSNQGARLAHASWVLSENGMYCCGKCNYKTDRKANFYKHRRLHIGTKPHVCPVCQYKAGTSSNLKRHMGIHKDIREHKCDICGLCFRQKIHLERHVKYKHEEKSVQCPLCDYVCANEQPDLKMHMKRKHSNGKTGEVLTCPECQVEVGSKKDLKQHMKFHKDGPELKLFCKECSFVTDCQSRLRRHAAIHSKLKPFQCGVCNYRAAQKEHVLRHLRTQHKIEVKREVRKTWRSRKQTDQENGKEKADFTSGDKIFACNHCTMRFAKLINLYKHLHTQHSDIMPPETSGGNYYCVVCEFSTTTKKNLLVHMRRHNMTDQTPPTHVYSCVLCRYVNPKRRNLFQHMRKKHNIDISGQGEEEPETQVLEMGDVIKSVKDGVLTPQPSGAGVATVVNATATNTGETLNIVDIQENTTTADLGNLANVIKIEDLTRGGTAQVEGSDGLATLVIDTADDASQIVQTTAGTTLLQHQQQHSADALEGLQALAEQAGLIDNVIEEQVHTVSNHEHPQQSQAVIIDQAASIEDGTTTGGFIEVVNSGDHLQELQPLQQPQQEDITGVSVGGEADAVVETTGDAAASEVAGMELSEEQLSSLRHGDMVEMDGELYLVEISQDPDQPSKQILSFVPVHATPVEDQ